MPIFTTVFLRHLDMVEPYLSWGEEGSSSMETGQFNHPNMSHPHWGMNNCQFRLTKSYFLLSTGVGRTDTFIGVIWTHPSPLGLSSTWVG